MKILKHTASPVFIYFILQVFIIYSSSLINIYLFIVLNGINTKFKINEAQYMLG